MLLGLGAHAGMLTYSTDLIGVTQDDGALNISVYDGEAGWGGTVTSGMFGDGTLLDYALYNADNNSAGYAAGSASLIGDATWTYARGNALNIVDAWETSDPDTGGGPFTTTPDFSGTGDVDKTLLAASFGGSRVDVSGLSQGTLWVVHGTYLDANQVTATLSGPGQIGIVTAGDQVAAGSAIGNNTGMWITAFTFDTDGGAYTDLDWHYANDDLDSSPGSRAKFVGVLLDDWVVPEPSTLALLGIAGATLIGVRRSRKS